jgi:hypothetical protein
MRIGPFVMEFLISNKLCLLRSLSLSLSLSLTHSLTLSLSLSLVRRTRTSKTGRRRPPSSGAGLQKHRKPGATIAARPSQGDMARRRNRLGRGMGEMPQKKKTWRAKSDVPETLTHGVEVMTLSISPT